MAKRKKTASELEATAKSPLFATEKVVCTSVNDPLSNKEARGKAQEAAKDAAKANPPVATPAELRPSLARTRLATCVLFTDQALRSYVVPALVREGSDAPDVPRTMTVRFAGDEVSSECVPILTTAMIAKIEVQCEKLHDQWQKGQLSNEDYERLHARWAAIMEWVKSGELWLT